MNRDLSANTRLSHYRIVSRLGAGGMGEVYLAEDTRLKRRVALKLLPAGFTQDAGRVRRFMQEAKAATALNHPNIVTVYDIGESESGRFIVMELVAGRTLRTVIAQDNTLETLLTLGQQIAKALSAAHAAGITHRDIKPDNIMVRDDGYVKVLDFGLARLRAATESDENAATLAQETMPGQVMGTLAYMSPEQASGQSVGHPTDIFALGVVLYELATGQHPFKAETLVGYLHAITSQTPPPVDQLKPAVPVALSALISRMLEKDPIHRPTAAEVAQSLLEIERGESTLLHKGEGETMILPASHSEPMRADEGFWVAVLPFKWRGANGDLEALAEGLTEDIVTGLSRFSYLRVIAGSSTLRYAGDSSDVRLIGKELGARYVMEGSLRQAGPMLRVAVQLLDTTTGAHLWAETWDRTFRPDNIFALQDELVPRMVSTVADWYGVLPHSMSETVRLKPPDQLSPYEAVLRSFGYFERIAPEEHAAVRAGLERAVERAPGNADGWAMLSMIYGEEHRFGFNAQPDPLGRALEAARRAVDAAHANHFAWLALAQALFFRKEFGAFREAAERAIALNPMDGSTLEYLAHLIAFAGDWDRGCDLAEQARQLNPNHPGWYWAVHFLDAYRRGDYHNARQYQLKNMMRGGGAQAMEQALNAALCGQLGEQEAAARALRTALSLQPDLPRTMRAQFEKWYLPELVEQLMEGLRKAGLEVVEAERATIPQPEAEKKPSAIQPVASSAQSVAVLPFANISADEENEYFCDGLAEELLNALAKIDDLKVAARTSAFSFKGKNAEAREIGKTLNVNTVLEGSVRRSGNRVRITVQLVNASDGYHLWSERYDREMKDIFDVQDEITLAVVDALKVKLLGEEKAKVTKRYTDNTEAYQLYLKGRFHSSRWTAEEMKKAIEFFEQAIEIEPDYAPAFVGLAACYIYLWLFNYLAPDESLPQMKAAAIKAMAIDSGLAESHYAIARMKFWYEWEFEEAEREFKKGIELNPNYSEARERYGALLAALDRYDEAVAEANRALEVDPLSHGTNLNVGWIFCCAGHYDRLLEQGRKLIELDANFYGGHLLMGVEAWARGDYQKAINAVQKAVPLGGGPLALSFLGCLYGIAGEPDKARQALKELQTLSARQYVLRCYFALIYAGMSEMDRAFESFEQAYQQRDGILVLLKHLARFIPGLSADRRLADLLRRIGLPTSEGQTVMLPPGTDGKQAADTVAPPAPLRHTVGRERERHELRAAFNTANDGRGLLLCVAGEPGIGKTTLVEDFLTELAAEHRGTIVRGRCSERLAGTEAYLPLLEALESLLQTNKSLAQTMRQIAPTWYAQVVPLSGESEESARLLAEVKAASQERMKRELANFLQAVAQPQPLVIFFDDLHWADVSTIDLLSFLAGKFDRMRVLIVAAYRPSDMLLVKHPFLQIKPDLQARGVCRELLLEFLSEAEIAEYLALEFPSHCFPAEFSHLIHSKTEGSPLFMTDLVRYLRDRNVIAQSSSTWMLAQTLPDIERELPESVRGMIERKIAQLDEGDRKLLAAASVQGYEFDSAVVARVLGIDADEVEERLEKLERVFAFVKLTSESEFPTRALTLRYRFVHVLYQNALYEGLRARRKATLSREVAQSLEGFYGERTSSVANELARLWEAAREYGRAADCFLHAARHALASFAHHEAAALSSRGLAMLENLPDGADRVRKELDLQLTLGPAVMVTKGWAAPELETIYSRARENCIKLGDRTQLFPVLTGLWNFHLLHADYRSARNLAEDLLDLAREGQDPALLVVAHWALVESSFWTADFDFTHQHIEQVVNLYDLQRDRSLALDYGQDPWVISSAYDAATLLLLGYPQQALKRIDETHARAHHLGHPFDIGIALLWAAKIHLIRREPHQTGEQATALAALSEQHGFAFLLPLAAFFQGWALAELGGYEEGITQMHRGLSALRATGAEVYGTFLEALMAEAMGRAARVSEAMNLIHQAIRVARSKEERFYEPELHRLKGELLQIGGSTSSEVASCFQEAIEIARRQGAKSLELRAATSLARLWRDQGKPSEAQQMLAETYGWFTEGLDTADLKEAKALLEELQQPNVPISARH